MQGNRTMHSVLTWCAAMCERAVPTFAAITSYVKTVAKSPAVVSSCCQAGHTALDRRERHHAARTERAEAPSGRDRAGSSHSQDRDRGNRGHDTEATGEARERLGGCEGTSREHNARAASRDRAGGCQREVGVMKHLRKINPHKTEGKDTASGEVRAGRFLDYVLDMYGPPSSVRLRTVVNGRAGFAQDKLRIRGYFKAASENAFGRKD